MFRTVDFLGHRSAEGRSSSHYSRPRSKVAPTRWKFGLRSTRAVSCYIARSFRRDGLSAHEIRNGPILFPNVD